MISVEVEVAGKRERCWQVFPSEVEDATLRMLNEGRANAKVLHTRNGISGAVDTKVLNREGLISISFLFEMFGIRDGDGSQRSKKQRKY
mmetsp:Transcript_21217/g.27346  ORF Transcript_21217/g.27346 Transcript_21217/m.27346 type:complete len:89 (+) Transcript_21217:1421-1687(+)